LSSTPKFPNFRQFPLINEQTVTGKRYNAQSSIEVDTEVF
jgi:hypothetical protein